MDNWLDQIKWNDQGLVPVVVQDASSKQVLMHAWMNRESLEKTCNSGLATYWSRSRQSLWTKGETSGHSQQVKSIALDCDNDTLLLEVIQLGGIACHTGRVHCFYQKLNNQEWQISEPVIKNPDEIYK